MGVKLGKSAFPSGSTSNDFECFGPIATEDGNFDNCKLADLGCFKQDGTDSNKFYHGAVVRHKKTNRWFTYFQWGRTGAVGDFQFVECADERDAQNEFAKQLHDKNDKRGEWVTKPGLGRILQAKAGKDCYLVRPLATRDTGSPGLPGARAVASSEVKVTTKKADTGTKKKSKKDLLAQYDAETLRLMRDFNVATVQYTKTSIQGGTIPTQKSIDEGRIVLIEAQKRVAVLGDNINRQITDKDLRDLTYHLYSRIPKIKPVGAPEATWILSKDNIFGWQQDLDAFESALAAAHVEIEEQEADYDPFGGMKIEMSHLPLNSEIGEWVREWMRRSSRNRHGNVGAAKVKNIWKVRHLDLEPRFDSSLKRIGKVDYTETPMFVPSHRPDLSSAEQQSYKDSHTTLLWHGSRSVNVPGILRTGLRLPKELVGVTITGALLGGGAYFADDWKKSAGYCSLGGSYWSHGSGSVKGRDAFMFLMDVQLGRPHTASRTHGYTSPPRGCHSVFGKADVTDMGYGSKLQNNEWVIYDAAQHKPQYLIEFSA